MKNIFKQSAESDTYSNQKEFKRAVILLTTYYTIGVFVILAIFNILVYGLFVNNLRTQEIERIEHSLLVGEEEDELSEERAEEIEDDLGRILLMSDGLIILLSVLVSYYLSRRTLLPLEKAYKKQARFVADAAHELRTPLSVMQAGSEVILRNDRSAGEYTKFIKESLDEIKRLTKLSNDLLFLARNNKNSSGNFDQVDFSEICLKQIESMRPYADTRKISIKESVEKNVYVKGGESDLVRLVINLLKNAIDYNKDGGTVALNLKKTNHGMVLKIEDTGVGIKKTDLAHIFDRFYKADSARSQNSSGTGLGLAIAKEIVEKHRGLIRVQSEINKGTTFEIILPLA